ncbi:Laminin subunit alpha-1 [Liparis tanakae]|uniref:Laminin subunit alpha-1 n=1 Tax=Liparis tanakae TaxID=230148 RepID=A0A4Z2EG59_9TELE|nr:Laminin subunit alpha-1 [Liparis tanakae]
MALTRLCSLLFLLFLVPLCTLGQRYRTPQQLPQKQRQQPGNHDSFSPTCHLDGGGELLCDRCQPGYTGPRCDRKGVVIVLQTGAQSPRIQACVSPVERDPPGDPGVTGIVHMPRHADRSRSSLSAF